MDPLSKVDSFIRARKLAVQGIYTWLPQFLVQRLYLHVLQSVTETADQSAVLCKNLIIV